MNDTVSAYVKGRQEGYFNVRLDSSILDMSQQSRAFFAKGYHIGKQNRQEETIVESEENKKDYILNRNAYITVMGYKAGSQGETVNSSLLKGDDKVAFEEGYKVGLLHKNGNMKHIDFESLEIYLMVTGYEITDEGYLVYLDILKDCNGLAFERGHKVKEICNSIQDVSINELNENQLDVLRKDFKR